MTAHRRVRVAGLPGEESQPPPPKRSPASHGSTGKCTLPARESLVEIPEDPVFEIQGRAHGERKNSDFA
jgi:hypothetical protein